MTDTYGRTIQLFLVDGKPGGLRKASLHGWTGTLCIARQSDFARLLKRDEVDRTGIYIFTGPDEDNPGALRAYIGSATCVRDRLPSSARDRPFWETIITVTTSDDDLSRGHAEYLEARVIAMARAAQRVRLEQIDPKPEGRRLPEADVANMEEFLRNLAVVLPVAGLDMLRPQPKAVLRRETVAQAEGQVQFEIRHKSGVQATAIEEDGEFIVLEGSEALTETGYVLQSYGGLKLGLLQSEVLVPQGTRLRFAHPWSFSSPSAAAAVVLDRNSNGRVEWKVKGSKQTYHDWQEAQASGAASRSETQQATP